MSPQLQEIADKLEIRELVARYCRAVDDTDAEAFAQAFTADGVFETALGVVTGRDALLAHGRKMVFGNVHITTDAIIEIDGDRATHTCTMCGRSPVSTRSGWAATMTVCPRWGRTWPTCRRTRSCSPSSASVDTRIRSCSRSPGAT